MATLVEQFRELIANSQSPNVLDLTIEEITDFFLNKISDIPIEDYNIGNNAVTEEANSINIFKQEKITNVDISTGANADNSYLYPDNIFFVWSGFTNAELIPNKFYNDIKLACDDATAGVTVKVLPGQYVVSDYIVAKERVTYWFLKNSVVNITIPDTGFPTLRSMFVYHDALDRYDIMVLGEGTFNVLGGGGLFFISSSYYDNPHTFFFEFDKITVSAQSTYYPMLIEGPIQAVVKGNNYKSDYYNKGGSVDFFTNLSYGGVPLSAKDYRKSLIQITDIDAENCFWDAEDHFAGLSIVVRDTNVTKRSLANDSVLGSWYVQGDDTNYCAFFNVTFVNRGRGDRCYGMFQASSSVMCVNCKFYTTNLSMQSYYSYSTVDPQLFLGCVANTDLVINGGGDLVGELLNDLNFVL